MAEFDHMAEELTRLREDIGMMELERDDALEDRDLARQQAVQALENLAQVASSMAGSGAQVEEASLDLAGMSVSELLQELRSPERALQATPNALRSWMESGYPREDRMREVLLAMNDASEEWRTRNAALGVDLKTWLAHEYGLTLAPNDRRLSDLHRDEFEFEGANWSRVNHVKVDDHTSPDRVGRIYFGIDTAGLRWVLDHVGVKLYGL